MPKLFRVTFVNQGLVYEIYAELVTDSTLFGFIEIENLVFGNQTSLVVDPSEERLKAEFEGVSSFYVPMHNIIRIDTVSHQGPAKVRDIKGQSGNITPFPSMGYNMPPEGKSR